MSTVRRSFIGLLIFLMLGLGAGSLAWGQAVSAVIQTNIVCPTPVTLGGLSPGQLCWLIDLGQLFIWTGSWSRLVTLPSQTYLAGSLAIAGSITSGSSAVVPSLAGDIVLGLTSGFPIGPGQGFLTLRARRSTVFAPGYCQLVAVGGPGSTEVVIKDGIGPGCY